MKKVLIFCLLSLIFGSAVFAAKPEFKPHLFLNVTFTGFWHKRDGLGWNILGVDVALIKYRAFYFLDFGVGLAGFCQKKTKWVYYGYYSWEITPDWKLKRVFHVISADWADYKDFYLSPYFKFSPVKVPMNITKNMRNRVFFDLAIFSQNFKRVDGIMIGLSFSFNVFKGKPGGEECEK